MEPHSYVKGSCGSDFAVFFIPAREGIMCQTVSNRKLTRREMFWRRLEILRNQEKEQRFHIPEIPTNISQISLYNSIKT